MTILATKTCVTCTKPCYPTERLMVSDLWVHKAGCMKCSACSATLSLNSVYVAPSPFDPGQKLLWCAKDVPKMVHTSVVDSIALKTAMNAPKCTSTPAAVFAKSKSQGKTLRFKGLTLRSKSIAQGLNAPKPEYSNGRQQAQQIFVGHVGAGLDSWDIAHAIAVQSQVRSPIRSHPAIHAQNTGSTAATALSVQTTGTISHEEQQQRLEGEISSAKTGEEGVTIEPDLVKNLIRVFQLDSMDAVEIAPTDDIVEDETVIVHDVLFDFAEHESPKIMSSSPGSASDPGVRTPSAAHSEETDSLLGALPGTIGRSAFYSTLRPSSFSLPPLPASTASSISTISNMSGLASTTASQCGTFRANGMGSFRSTLTMRTLGTIGSKRGTLTLARIKGTLRRPALQGLFQPPGLEVEQVDSGLGSHGEGEEEEAGEVGFASPRKGKGGLELPDIPSVPANTPMKSPYAAAFRPTLPSDGDLARMLKGRSSSAIKDGAGMDAYTNAGSIRGTSLLKALLPLAAHLVPLPDDDDTYGDDAHVGDGGYFGKGVMDTAGIKYVGEEDAEQAILESLEMGGLELIMMFEEEAEPLPVSSGIFL